MIIALLVVILGGVYSQTFTSSIYGADSGDLVAAAVVGGVAHPPGYPLYLILARLFLLLPLDLSPAGKVNLFSLITTVLAIAFFYLLVGRLAKDKLVAFLASLTLAFTVPFWLYSTIAEVYPLSTFLVVIILLLALKIVEESRRLKRLQFSSVGALAFTIGLFLTHSWYTFLLIAPTLMILLWPTRKYFAQNFLLPASLFLILGLLPYLYAPLAASANPPVNWDNPQTLSGLMRLITRADYGPLIATQGLYGSAPTRLIQPFWFAGFLWADFTLVGIFLALVGAFTLYKKNKNWFWACLAGFVVSGPLFLTYADYPTNSPFLLSAIEQFVLIPYLFFAIFLAFGIIGVCSYVIGRVKPYLQTHYLRSRLPLITIGLKLSFVILPLYLLMANFLKVDLSDFKLGDKLALDVLATAEPNAIIILQDDTVTFNTTYAYYALKARPDVAIVSPGHMRHSFYRNYLRTRYPNLLVPQKLEENSSDPGFLNALYTKALFEANLGKVPIYAYAAGPQIDGWRLVPVGILDRLYPEKGTPSLKDYKLLNEAVWSRYQFGPADYQVKYRQLVVEHMIGVYALSHLSVAHYFSELGDFDSALVEVDEAIAMFGNNAAPWLMKGQIGLLQKDCSIAGPALKQAKDLDKRNPEVLKSLIDYYRDCENDGSKVQETQKLLEEITYPQPLKIPLEKF